MPDLKFTTDHEWIRVEGDTAVIGITDYAQQQLGDVVFVELPDVGKVLERGKEAAVVESVKAASEVYAPIDGEVVETNALLLDQPATVNTDPHGEGWFVKVKLSDVAQLDALLDETQYKNMIAELT
jgi:glycine cleavage system H protein